MTRTTITLPDELAELARSEAQLRGSSLSAVVRQALEASLRPSSPRRLPWQGIVADGQRPARELDHHLNDWADDIAGDR